MPLARIIRLDDYRPARASATERSASASPCVILQLFRAPPARRRPFSRFPTVRPDDDRVAGRNRDPG